jgi:hypothetical protein
VQRVGTLRRGRDDGETAHGTKREGFQQEGRWCDCFFFSASSDSLASRRVDARKAQIVQLRARDAEITERIECDHRERGEVRAALAEAEAELEVEVNAPVANGVDPTEWLPEELLMAILIQVVTAGVCGLVCRR